MTLDINPSENSWDLLKQNLEDRTSKTDLKQYFGEVENILVFVQI